ncbi:hypothetical protein ACFX2H_023233 [Malus domestica]
MSFLWAGSSSWAKNKITFQHLGLPLFECGTGEFPFTSNEGPILDDPSPTPSKHQFSPEFCSFIEACLQKDADERPTAEQLLSHPFITKYEDSQVNIGEFARSVFDPTQRMKDLADLQSLFAYASSRCTSAGYVVLTNIFQRSSSSLQLRNSKTSKLERQKAHSGKLGRLRNFTPCES